MKTKIEKRISRHKSIRAKVKGAPERPRLSIFRSNRHIFAQLIDDTVGKTIVSTSDLKKQKSAKKPIKSRSASGGKKLEIAKRVGLELAKAAELKGIKKVVFDRGGYKYHGRTKAVAEGAREGGLKF